MFHKEGYKIITGSSVLFVGLLLLVNQVLPTTIIGTLIMVALLVFYILILQFFRNPKRNTKIDASAIIAPADGKVVVIEKVNEPEYFKKECTQISIFMSPLNVHVNRYPISGEVVYEKYYKGKYLVAWHPKSSTENERTTVVVKGVKGEVLFRQIAGAVARRIVKYSRTGDQAKQGEDFGFIKFGSRVDVFIPNDCNINVKLDAIVKGGETILATYP